MGRDKWVLGTFHWEESPLIQGGDSWTSRKGCPVRFASLASGHLTLAAPWPWSPCVSIGSFKICVPWP